MNKFQDGKALKIVSMLAKHGNSTRNKTQLLRSTRCEENEKIENAVIITGLICKNLLSCFHVGGVTPIALVSVKKYNYFKA